MTKMWLISSRGFNHIFVSVCTPYGFDMCVGALVYYIDSEDEECKVAYPDLHLDRNIVDGRGMVGPVLTLSIGNNQGTGGVEFGKIYDISCQSSSASSVARPAASWT